MKTIIIAEAGVNHNGSEDLARQLIDKARWAGADYVKFQTSLSAATVTSRFAPMADYQKVNLHQESSQLEMLKNLGLSFDAFSRLNDYCKEVGIKFLSTPFDLPSVDFLTSLGMDFMKIPSGEITNLPYLRRVARVGLPVVMSTGMSSLPEIEMALSALYAEGLDSSRVTLLHCNTEYPTPMADVNLRAMQSLRRDFGTKVGYSDHTRGIEVPIAAVALGAQVIEKHFTLSRELPGPDHVASLEPHELKQMVSSIRNIESALGTDEKTVSESERKNIAIARRSIVAATDIKAGDILTEMNLAVKRPGTGVSPMLWDSVVGTRAVRDFCADELIEI